MTIGQKITSLRVQAGLSQEDLAEKLSVSRQSVSKWEMDQAIPQLDKALLLFSIQNLKTPMHIAYSAWQKP